MEHDQETINIFLEDSREGLANVARELVILEENPGNADVLASIFRALHSIKGNAALMEYRRLSTLAHAGESLLGRLRKGELRLTPEMTTALLAAFDAIRDSLDQIEKSGEEGEIDFTAATEQLSRVSVVGETQAEPAGARPAAGDEPAPARAEEAATGVGSSAVPSAADSVPAILRQQAAALLEHCGRDLAALRQEPDRLDLLNDAYRGLRRTGLSIDELDVDEADDPQGLVDLLRALERIIDPLRKRRAELTPELLALLERGLAALTAAVVGGAAAYHGGVSDTTATLAELEIAASALQRERAVQRQPTSTDDAVPTPAKARVLRVDVKKVDALMNLVGEYVIGSSRLEQQIANLAQSLGLLQDLHEVGRQQAQPVGEAGDSARAVTRLRPRAELSSAWQELGELVADHGRLLEEVVESREALDQIFSQLQEGLLRVRMMPVATVFQKFPRIVRDLRRNLDKDIRLIVTGDETEVDKSIVEVLSDPLLHIIRNSADHGIESPEERIALGKPETGTIHLSAAQEGNQIVVAVADDGKGLDAAVLKARAQELGLVSPEQAARMTDREAYGLIFHAGFSTARVVTELSGRGVGMDVVKENLARIKGAISIDSRRDRGTTVSLRLPLTLAIVNALLVEVRGHCFAIPLTNVTETIMLPDDAVRLAGQKEIFQLRGHVESLVRLEEFLQLPAWDSEAPSAQRLRHAQKGERPVVLVESVEKRVGLLVDEVLARKEIVIKPLGDFMKAIRCLAGATILGDGRVVPILDVGQMVQEVVGGITTGNTEEDLVSA